MTHKREGEEDKLAQQYVKDHRDEMIDILIAMVNTPNFFAKREALKLLNLLLRDDFLADMMLDFVSSVVLYSLANLI